MDRRIGLALGIAVSGIIGYGIIQTISPKRKISISYKSTDEGDKIIGTYTVGGRPVESAGLTLYVHDTKDRPPALTYPNAVTVTDGRISFAVEDAWRGRYIRLYDDVYDVYSNWVYIPVPEYGGGIGIPPIRM